MNIVVVGSGALGQLIIHTLIESGHLVSTWQRQTQPQLTLQLITANQRHSQTLITSNSRTALRQCQLLVVTTKAQDIQTALQALTPDLSADCPIVLLHNGLGVVEQLESIKQPLLHAVTTHAVCKIEAGYLQTATGHTDIGPLNPAAKKQQSLAKVLNSALPTVTWHDNILPYALKKFAINCVINPLAVEYHCKNGDLLLHRARISLLCQEIVTVLNRLDVDFSAEMLYQQVIEVIQRTAGNTCSMLQDIQAKRSTEIDFITGYLLQLAAKNGLVLPLNQALYQQVKQAEVTYAA
jgi:2-dehydropantoate 2-reductase